MRSMLIVTFLQKIFEPISLVTDIVELPSRENHDEINTEIPALEIHKLILLLRQIISMGGPAFCDPCNPTMTLSPGYSEAWMQTTWTLNTVKYMYSKLQIPLQSTSFNSFWIATGPLWKYACYSCARADRWNGDVKSTYSIRHCAEWYAGFPTTFWCSEMFWDSMEEKKMTRDFCEKAEAAFSTM